MATIIQFKRKQKNEVEHCIADTIEGISRICKGLSAITVDALYRYAQLLENLEKERN